MTIVERHVVRHSMRRGSGRREEDEYKKVSACGEVRSRRDAAWNGAENGINNKIGAAR